ncbi:unnamed protein product [Linum trigynum]|uniref:Uncharacterized protein n=1 Tax=Linum trigynum TaxID=586398 RepID=A0AAV2DD74_9ROSI
MDPHIQVVSQTDFSFPRETKETLRSIRKHTEVIVKACAQFSQDNLYATIQVEKEVEEVNHEDVVEHTEVVIKSSSDDHEQKCPAVADHTFPHPSPSAEETGMSENMQSDLIEKIAWKLALQSMPEEEERERMRKEVVEDDGSELEEVLDLFPGEESNSKEGRGFEEAIGVQAEDEVEVEEACTGYELHVISPPKFEELLGKDPFAVFLCQTKATSTLVPLGGHDGGQSMLSYLVWGNETREEEKKRSRRWRLHIHQVHEPTSPVIPHARDLRLRLADENLNFKEVLAWAEI